MTQQYKDLKENLSIEIKPEDKRKALCYRISLIILKCIIYGSILLVIRAIIFHLGIKGPIFVLCVFLCIMIFLKTFDPVGNTLLKKCDPIGSLSTQMARYKYECKKVRRWEIIFYNLGETLFYAGRFDDAEKVAQLMKKYCVTSSGEIRAALICAKIAYAQENTSKTIECVTTLSNLAYKVENKNELLKLVHGVQLFPVYLELIQAKQYQNLYGFYKNIKQDHNSRLSIVQRNYYMYEISKLAGNIDVAKEHKEYVLKHGGTTWYRTKIMQIE